MRKCYIFLSLIVFAMFFFFPFSCKSSDTNNNQEDLLKEDDVSTEVASSEETTIKPAEFVVLDLTATPDEVTAGESCQVLVRVANIGEESGDYTVMLMVDDKLVATEKVSIAGGEVKTVNFDYETEISTTEGQHMITVGKVYVTLTVESVYITQSIVSSETESEEEIVEQEQLPSGFMVDKDLCFEDASIQVFFITYMSDGLRVKGYLAQPRGSGPYPAVVYNRGGNLEFGKMTCETLKIYAYTGFVAIGSQYRGNDGGEGREEFGGVDINDVMNLIPILAALPNVDAEKIGMVGYSRGGMMTYLALKEQTIRGTNDIKAACTVGGTADLFINAENRDDMLNDVFIPLIGVSPSQKPEEYEDRSATYWADMINTPLLIQHGEFDWRVLPSESRKLVEELEKYGKDYKLITYPGDDHGSRPAHARRDPRPDALGLYGDRPRPRSRRAARAPAWRWPRRPSRRAVAPRPVPSRPRPPRSRARTISGPTPPGRRHPRSRCAILPDGDGAPQRPDRHRGCRTGAGSAPPSAGCCTAVRSRPRRWSSPARRSRRERP